MMQNCSPERADPFGENGVRRRDFIAFLGMTTAAWPCIAQTRPKMLHVGFSGMLPRGAPHYAAFEQRMAELGYQQGGNFVFEFLQSPGIEGYQETYRELAARRVDILLVAGNEPALAAARAAAGATPIVLAALDFDPVRQGLCRELVSARGECERNIREST